MSKQYFDQPINASTKWGGDRSTGGLQVKGRRIQEWIKAQIANLLEADSSFSERLGGDEEAIAALVTLVAKKTPVVFNGFVLNAIEQQQSAGEYDEVVFDTAKGYFLAVVGSGLSAKYYANFDGIEKYSEGFRESPFADKVYICGKDTYVWNGEELACTSENMKAAIIEALEDGSVTAAVAETLEGWADDELSVTDEWEDSVRTTGGDISILTDAGGKLLSIAPRGGSFTMQGIRTSGYNLLRLVADGGIAQAVGGGWYFPVPKLTFGTYGTAKENNGVLFTNAQGANLTPTVLFKPFANGVPANVNDGTACPYHDEQGLRFYTTSGPGYLIVSGITRTNVCAHVAWEDWYNKYVAADAEGDGGSYIDLSSLFATPLLYVGNGVYDEIKVSGTTATRTTRCGVVGIAAADWSTVEDESGYTHSATVSSMKNGGAACLADGTLLQVNGNTVSYTDNNAAIPSTVTVWYELATATTATASSIYGAGRDTYKLDDCGLEILQGATGNCVVQSMYAQNIPDALAEIARTKMGEALDAIGGNEGRVSHVESEVADPTAETLPMLCGQPMKLYAAGTPAEALVPDNWIPLADGGYAWTGLPTVIGQEYIDTENGGKYEAVWDNFTQRTLKWLKV